MLVDTTVLVDVLRGLPAARPWVEAQPDVLAASEVTRVEILRGMRSAERPAVQAALDALHWFAVDAETATRAGQLGRRYRHSHDLAVADLIVAATAQVHDLPLVTSNIRHFPMIDGLQPPY